VSCEKHPTQGDRLYVSQINVGKKTVAVVSGVAAFVKLEDMKVICMLPFCPGVTCLKLVRLTRCRERGSAAS